MSKHARLIEQRQALASVERWKQSANWHQVQGGRASYAHAAAALERAARLLRRVDRLRRSS